MFLANRRNWTDWTFYLLALMTTFVMLFTFLAAVKADYPKCYSNAVRDGLPCVVYVDCPVEPIDGAWCCRVESLADFPTGSVVISLPSDGVLYFDRCLKHGEKIELRDPVDALNNANRERAARGLPPFIRDEGLSQAAKAAATHRAANCIEGHCGGQMGDFAFVPSGTTATAAGCAAWSNDGSFGSCCLYDGYVYAGAATVIGADGRAYHHLYVR